MDQRSASQSHEAPSKPPRPLMAAAKRPPSGNQIQQRAPSGASSKQNIQRLLKNKGGSENDPLAEEQQNYNTSQTEMMAGGQNSDFFEEGDANQYMMTKFQENDNNRRQRSRTKMPMDLSGGQLTSKEGNTTEKNHNNAFDKISGSEDCSKTHNNDHQEAVVTAQQMLPTTEQPSCVNSTLTKNVQNKVRTMEHHQQLQEEQSYEMTLNSGYDFRRGSGSAGGASYPASAVNQHKMQIVNPMTPSDAIQTQYQVRVSTSCIREQQQPVDHQGESSCMSPPNQAQIAVLPSGLHNNIQGGLTSITATNNSVNNPQQLICDNSEFTEETLMNAAVASGNQNQQHQNIAAAIVVPPAINNNSNLNQQLQQLHINNKSLQNNTTLPEQIPEAAGCTTEEQLLDDNFNATLTAQIVTGEVQQNITSNETTQQRGRQQEFVSGMAPQADEYDQTNRRILTDSLPETVAEQVQSAEFAMSTFNILNNKEMPVGHSSDDMVVKTQQNTTGAEDNNKVITSAVENENRCATAEQVGGGDTATASVQRAHILSGTRELKQSNSVLTGAAAGETSTIMSNPVATTKNNLLNGFANQPPLVDTESEVQKDAYQSKTMMQKRNYPAATSHEPNREIDRPNKPNEQHFDAVDIQKTTIQSQNREVNKPISEQFVYSRLPKNYFMEDAEEQMDIDIAINDIKQMRQGFISYVNEQGVPAEPDDLDEQMDNFLDPSKFIERHFGSENPDIIFSEVLDQVPDPPQPRPVPAADEIVDEIPQGVQQDDEDIAHDDLQMNGEQQSHFRRSLQEIENKNPGSGGFTEQNVTPLEVPDMWADNDDNNLTEGHQLLQQQKTGEDIAENQLQRILTTGDKNQTQQKHYQNSSMINNKNLQQNNIAGTTTDNKDNNLITGETFLKDARQIDQSIEEMNAMVKTVDSLQKPYNDNEMAQQHENTKLFPKGTTAAQDDGLGGVVAKKIQDANQMITIAIESQEAIVSEMGGDINESQQMIGLETFENTEDQIRCAQSEDNIGDYEKVQASANQFFQQRVLAINENHQKNTLSKQSVKANEAALEINITRKRRKGRDVGALYHRKPVKVLRMADYFKPSNAHTLSALNMSGATTADVDQSAKDLQSQLGMSELDTIAQETKMKEELDAKLEQDILDNVDVNFIFNKGTSLTSGLIDPDRIFSVMNKLKELAYKQLQSGSNQINYAEIVAYLKDSEGFFADEIVQKEDRKKLYAGEVDINKSDEKKQTSSVQQIAKEPVLVGLENDQDEKKRRWTQCINFLRNNPKLLLQMIPDPDEDSDFNLPSEVISVGKPRPSRKSYAGKPPKIVPQKTGNSQGFQNRYLAISQDQRSGPAQNQKFLHQRPIKVRQNALRSKQFSSRRASDKPISSGSQQKIQVIDDVMQERRIETEEAEIEMPAELEENKLDEDGEVMDDMLNIQTRPNQIQNPSNLEVEMPKLPLSTPETTKFNGIKQIPPEGCIIVEDGHDEMGQPYQSTRQKRQQSAVTRTTTQKIQANQRRQGSTADLRQKNSLQNKISALRGNSGSKGRGQFEASTKFIGPRKRINAASAMQQNEEEGSKSFTITPSNITNMYNTTMNRGGFFSNSHGNQNNVNSVYRRPTGQFNDRNQIQNHFYGNNMQNPRIFKSNKNVNTMTRVLSESFSNYNQTKRPITAVQGPALQQAHGLGRRRLASNSILNISAQNRQNNRKLLLQGAKDHMRYLKNSKQNNNQVEQPEPNIVKQDSAVREQATSAVIPSIFRQSNEEMSALSGIQQDGGPFYFYDAGCQPEQKMTADASSQYCAEDHHYDSNRRSLQKCNIEVQTDIQDVTSELTDPKKVNERSLQSHFGIALQAHVDWAYTPLCIAVLNKKLVWNQGLEKRVFVEAEVDVVLQMIKGKFKEFNQTDKLAPYHAKALETLKELLIEQGLDSLVARFQKQYLEITVENTIKMLLRSKLVFSARQLFIGIFEKILRYEVATQDAKRMIESKETYKLPLQELNELRLKCGRMYESGEKVIHEIKLLRADRKGQYSQPFIFKKKDLTLQIKNEVAEVRQLIKVYRVRRQTDSQNSDKPARFEVITDDEVSEREEVRDSNYVGTDLYWENRFYQVKPFKKPEESDYYYNDIDGAAAGADLENQGLECAERIMATSGEDEVATRDGRNQRNSRKKGTLSDDQQLTGNFMGEEDIVDKEFVMI